ncbi:MAG: sigma-70 family RNA polymerase sigma factor [Labilithrix sp.]|nr:sigma-70 family RNA polymerase sigma factor [Labilithrix sp.]
MTLAFSPGARAAGREHHTALGGDDVRRGLAAMLRRRVPSQEVEDVAQTVLADALASGAAPADPEELRRWLSGIARHKIADFHRQQARMSARMAGPEPLESAVGAPTAFEERQVLHALLGEKRSRREAETMEWLVREHAGERLADIASENGVPAPVVRQRVSRLRRALRSRWTNVFGLLALLAGLSALGLAASAPREAIAPDPAADVAFSPTAPASATPADTFAKEAAGDWVVRTVTPSRPLNAAEQRLVDLEAKNAKVRIRGKRVELETRGFKTTWQITSVEKSARGMRVGLRHANGSKDTADVVLVRDSAGPRLDVTLPGPRFGGTVSLRRPAP